MNLYFTRTGFASFLRSPNDESGTPAPAVGTTSPADTNGTGAAPSSEESGGDDFTSFGSDDFDSVDLGAASEPSQDDPPAQPAPVEKPTPAATPVAQEKVDPPAPAAAPAPKEATAPPPSEILSAIEGMTTNGPAIVAHLASTTFALTKEEADAFELDAVATVPKLMARVHLEATKNTLNLINRMVPNLIESAVAKITSGSEKAKEAISEFYSTNSDLNAKDHGALVAKWSKAFRAQNPSASRQEAIKFVGQAIRTELGLPTLAAAPVPRPQPFAPARPGVRQPTAQVVENPFEAMGLPDDD